MRSPHGDAAERLGIAMARTSMSVDVHNAAVEMVNEHANGIVCVTFGEFPVSARLYFEDTDAMVAAAIGMLRKAGLASWEIDLLLGYQPEPAS